MQKIKLWQNLKNQIVTKQIAKKTQQKTRNQIVRKLKLI